MKTTVRYFSVLIFFIISLPTYGQTENVDTAFSRISNIGLALTDFGVIGSRNMYWPDKPSCEYPLGSRIEHLYQGGLWVGAKLNTIDGNDPRNGKILVSTAVNDWASNAVYNGAGFEFTPSGGMTITERSSDPGNPYFDPAAVSDEDFITTFTDMNTYNPRTGDSIFNHIPMGIAVQQESFAWASHDGIIIIRYIIKNISPDTLDSVYVGMWNDAAVRNTNLVPPGTPGYFNYTAYGFDSSSNLAYAFDFNGMPGGSPANSYFGISLLGSTSLHADTNSNQQAYYSAWTYRSVSGTAEFLSPTDDWNPNFYLSRYNRMTSSLPNDYINQLRISPANASILLSTGPFQRLAPDDSIDISFAILCATKYGTSPAHYDSSEQRLYLYNELSDARMLYANHYITSVTGSNHFIPNTLTLAQNFPNPFNPATTISFSLPKSSFVTIKVYNVLGQIVNTIVNERRAPGTYSVQFDASNLPSGVYFYRLNAGEFMQTKKMLVIR
jgi:hypothetical protein